MTKSLYSWLVLLFFFLLAVFVPTNFMAEDTLPIPARQTVRVGFFRFDGYHQMDDRELRSGYGYELLQMMARYNNWRYEYSGYDNDWEDMLEMLERGDIDLVTSAQKTPNRLQQFLFSDRPIGTSATILTVRSGSTRIASGDYRTYNGIRVGMLNGSSRNDSFSRFAAEKGFTYSPVFFESVSDMEGALQAGTEIDAIVTSNLRRIHDEWILEQFDPSPFYVITRKDDTQLMKEINLALSQMDLAVPAWRTELMNKFYVGDNGIFVPMTAAERVYLENIKNHSVVFTAIVRPDNAPYSYFENGEAKGIIPEIFAEITRRTGIQYRVIETTNFEEYSQAIISGQADIVMDAYYNYQWADRRKVQLTDPFLTSTITQVTPRNLNHAPRKIAILRCLKMINSIDKLAGDDVTLVPFDSSDQCVQAVMEGHCDAAYLYTYVAQKVLHDDTRNRLQMTVLPKFQVQFDLAVSNNSDYRLLSLLNKSVTSMSQSSIQEIVLQHTALGKRPFYIIGYLYENPIEAIFVVILLAILVTATIVSLHHARAERTNSQREVSRRQIMSDALETARHASEAKGNFLSRISHEIRTPLNAIIGYITMAKNHSGDAEKQDYCLDQAEKASHHLLRIINDVLDISSIESGRMKIAHEEFNLRIEIDSVVAMFEHQVMEAGLDFQVGGRDAANVNVIGDALRVRQVLVNLISNAVKFTPRGGKVSLSIERVKDMAAEVVFNFKVHDTGIGMSQDYLKRIFQPFEQADSHIAQTYGGTGLGLSISKNLVTMMRGSIDVQSQPGKGTCFTVILPFAYAKAPSAQAAATAAAGIHRNLSGMRILVAEDNPMNSEILVEILNEAGIQVDTAGDGQEAVRQFEQSAPGQYQCILMDMQMPIMNGVEATKAIRALPDGKGKAIPIIAVTADAFAEDMAQALASGMNDYLTKPVDFPKLLHLLHKYI